jgi:hypothetical protein
MMSKIRTTKLWSRTTKALGKFIAGVVALRAQPRAIAARDEIYPRFPMF